MVHSPMAYLVSPHASIKLNERGHVGKNDSHCGSKSKKLKHLGNWEFEYRNSQARGLFVKEKVDEA